MITIRAALLPLLVLSAYYVLAAFTSTPDISRFQGRNYLVPAYHLVTKNTFSASTKWKHATPDRYISPGFPAFIAFYASMDAQFKASLICIIEKGRKRCKNKQGLTRIYYTLLFISVFGLLAAWFLAFILSGSKQTAFLTLILLVLADITVSLSGYLYPYVFPPALIYLSLIFLVLCLRYNKVFPVFLTGCLLGVVSLILERFFFGFVILLFAIPLFFLFNQQGKYSGKSFQTTGAAFILLWAGFMIIVFPWAFRNYLLFGDFWLTSNEFAREVSMRRAYNQMSVLDSFKAVLYWFPGMPTSLGEIFAGQELAQKLGLSRPGTYISQGVQDFKSSGNSISELHRQLLLWIAHPFSTLLTSIPLTIRGVFGGGGYIALFGLFFISTTIKYAKVQKESVPVLAVFTFLLGLSLILGFVTPNIYWYNISAIFVFCFATGYALGCL